MNDSASPLVGFLTGLTPCLCGRVEHQPVYVVVTGGPGAGKTAILESARQSLCTHVAILPEAAGIVFGGGFPRGTSQSALRAAQRTIFRVQVELQRLMAEEQQAALVLCDRGTLDGFAYWPDSAASFWENQQTTEAEELARYAAVIHLETPRPEHGYNHDNPLRIESAREARAIDDRIAQAWSRHPRRFTVPCSADFVVKFTQALALIRAELPACCQAHDRSED
jgi:predicted ATPase